MTASRGPYWTKEQHEEYAARVESIVDATRKIYEETKNPIFAWLAIAQLSQVRHRLLFDQPSADGIKIPEWCADYFSHVAELLIWLANGLDPYAGSMQAVIPGQTPVAPRQLSPDEAADRVTRVLEIRTQGRNAFKNYRSSQKNLKSFQRLTQLQSSGLSYDDALALLAGEGPATESSVVRKRVTKGKALRGLRPSQTQPPKDTGKT